MTDNRILIANFRLSRRVKTASLYQYDYGQILRFLGVSLPNTYEVHFSVAESGGEAVTVLGNAEGVQIPDALLATGNTVHAWIFLHDAQTDGETEYKVEIPVIRRPKVTDAEPTPVQQDVITQAIAALNEGVERVEETVEGVQEAIETALQEAKDSGEFDGNDGTPGRDGQDGVSPTASITQTATGATVTVTDASGTTEANLTNGQDGQPGRDGQDGAPGQDGVSPTISVTDITGGHRVTITDATGAHSFDVMDGEGAVQDVQVNGASVLSDGVANVPVASTSTLGVVKPRNGFGISVDGAGQIYTVKPNDAEIKEGIHRYNSIVPFSQHLAAFYGLAKAAGDSTQSVSSNAVGNYTESAKSAISEMLNGSVSVSGTTPTINAMPGVRYVCGEVSTIDIVTPESGIVDVVFTSGATAAVLTVTPPTGMTMKWANGFDPTSLEANTVYEINIADGCLGVCGTWS